MGKPHYFWYRYVQDCIRHYKDDDDSPMGRHMKNAVDAALAQTAETPDGSGSTRVQLIRMVLINHTHDLSGAAWQLSVSSHTAQRYAASFIYLTAAYAGFPSISHEVRADFLPSTPNDKAYTMLNAWSIRALTPSTQAGSLRRAVRLRR